MIGKRDVEQFLSSLKDKIRVFDIVFRPRDKNLDSLAALDITAAERLRLLIGLTADDYCAGPKPDTMQPDRPDYYEFGLQIKGMDVYIKISPGMPGKPADCMSFHIAERALAYPFKPHHP